MHTEVIHRVMELLVGRVAGRARLRLDGQLALSGAEPAPDLALVAPLDYADGHPRAAYLVVDVADALSSDEGAVRAGLYARGDIPEYWRIDLRKRAIEVYTGPAAGGYRQVTTRPRGAFVSLVEFPDIRLAVADIV